MSGICLQDNPAYPTEQQQQHGSMQSDSGAVYRLQSLCDALIPSSSAQHHRSRGLERRHGSFESVRENQYDLAGRRRPVGDDPK